MSRRLMIAFWLLESSMHCRDRNWQLLAAAVPSSTLNPELESISNDRHQPIST